MKKEEKQHRKQNSKYPRPELPESNEKNLDLGGSYQNFLYSLGNCCGNFKLICPCLCCVNDPQLVVNQGEVGIF